MTNTIDSKIILCKILYIILGEHELHWIFSSILKDGSDSHRFFNRKWVLAMYTFGNL